MKDIYHMKITPIGNRWDDEWPYKVKNPFASYMYFKAPRNAVLNTERAREAVAWLTSDNNIAWQFDGENFYFKDAEIAVEFKLKFC